MDNLPKDSTLTKDAFDILNIDPTLKPDNFAPLATDKNVSGGGFDKLQPETTLSKSPMQLLSTDNAINGGGFDKLTTNTDISGSGMDALKIDKTIQGGGMEGVAPTGGIAQDTMQSLNVSTSIISTAPTSNQPTDVFNSRLEIPLAGVTQNTNQNQIQGGGLDPINLNKTVSQSPMEIAPRPGSVSPKSENFDQPPSAPSISPKNVFRNN
jgi:hypothetical protein